MDNSNRNSLIAFVCPKDLDAYAAAAERLAAAGATHMLISALSEKSRYEIEDVTDPYLHWAIGNATFFKFAPPEALGGCVPAEFAEANIVLLRRRSEILKRFGLRGAFWCVEPMYLPESVFEAHPEWRGPRVDQPRRSRHPRFAPCLDRPEVLAMYQESARRILAAASAPDTILIGSNDSGAGICWSDGLYPEPNGPTACRNLHYGKRVADWVEAIQRGARDAGGEVEVFVGTHAMSEAQVAALAAVAPRGMGFRVRRGAETLAAVPHMKVSSFAAQSGKPVIGIPNPWALIQAVAAATQADRASVSFETGIASAADGEDLMLKVFRMARTRPTETAFARMQVLRDAARDEAGDAGADLLFDMWMNIERGLANLNLLSFGGTFTQIAIPAQRWLTRPFVPFPLELTPDEKDYYRPFLFQANSEEEAADMTNLQANKVVVGVPHARTIARLMAAAADPIRKAALQAASLSEASDTDAARDAFGLLALRLRSLGSVIRTCSNAPQFQAYMDRRKALAEVPPERPEWTPGEPERTWVMDLFRDELDNVTELIGLMRSAPAPIFETAPDKEREDPFTFGPDLVGQLEKKRRIMMDHWLDFDRLYPRPNR